MHAYAIHTTSSGRCGGRRGTGADRALDVLSHLFSMSGWNDEESEEERGRGERHHHRHHHHPGGRGRGGGGGGGGFGGFPFGGFGPGGGPGWRGGRKARRGDIRTAALLLLAEEPRNGYQIMQAVEERSEGAWRPSPGSVYPALQQLEDEGLIRSEEIDGRRAFRLTDAGRAHVEERGADRPAPWEQMSGEPGNKAHELGKLIREVAMASAQVLRTGSEEQQERARKALVTARRGLYQILADGEDGDPSTAEGADSDS